jgi:hypothetical protein
MKKLSEKDSWLGCAICMAKMGLGCKTTGRLLSKKPNSISQILRKRGVERYSPDGGSWMVWLARKTKPSDAYRKARMKDIKDAASIGFDWSCIWRYEKQKRDQRERYHAMTDEQKKDQNKRVTERRKERHEQDPQAYRKHREQINKWKRDNPEKARESQRKAVKKRMMNDPAFRATTNMRREFRRQMKRVKDGGSAHYSDKLGCTTEEFNKHMELMFTTEMTWDNYGTYWVVDHVLPVASFDHTDKAQVKRCWHYTNLQPMEAMENIKKSDKITQPQMNLTLGYA